MEKERQDSAELQLARPWVNLEYLIENTNFYGTERLYYAAEKWLIDDWITKLEYLSDFMEQMC